MPASRDWVGVFWNGSKEQGPRGGKERGVGEGNNGCFGNYNHPVLGFNSSCSTQVQQSCSAFSEHPPAGMTTQEPYFGAVFNCGSPENAFNAPSKSTLC